MKQLTQAILAVVFSITLLIVFASCGRGNETIQLIEEMEQDSNTQNKVKKKFALTEFLIPLGSSEFEYTVKRKDKKVVITGGIVEPVTKYPLRIVLNSDNRRRLITIKNETTTNATIVLREDVYNYPKALIQKVTLNGGFDLFGGVEVITLEPNTLLRVRKVLGNYYFVKR